MNTVSEITQAAQHYASHMTRFLRDLIRIPGEGQQEGAVVQRIREELNALEYDCVQVDDMGNILGTMGSGDRIIAFDAHIDTVGPGVTENWSFDPYMGYEDDSMIGGRGASDQLSGLVSAVYGIKIAKDLNLIPDGYCLLVTGTVQEEECEGMNWQFIVEKDGIRPEFVVLTEPTDGNIYRGHRGRADIIVEVPGVSAHGSTPQKGSNAICHMAEIIQDIETITPVLRDDPFLGKGTLAITQIFFNSPSRCAVPDRCSISIDRRLTKGETVSSALEELSRLPSVLRYNAVVRLDRYSRPSWTGYAVDTSCDFPVWEIPETHRVCRALCGTVSAMGITPVVDKWDFSTNGVSIAGKYEIPCIGYGPGIEGQAHAPDEKMPKADLQRCAAVYALLAHMYDASEAGQ